MRRALAAALAAALIVSLAPLRGAGAAEPTAASPVRLPDLDNRLVDPFLASETHKAIVFLFASVDCPISNRYAPVVQRLYQTFAPQEVAFWMIYPNPSETPAAIQKHLEDFGYPVHALRDPSHALAKLAKVVVTPEAAVFDRHHQLTYHGRIDDRYVSIGVERPAATQHDLADALTATLAGRPVRQAATTAVGCYIADFVQ